MDALFVIFLCIECVLVHSCAVAGHTSLEQAA